MWSVPDGRGVVDFLCPNTPRSFRSRTCHLISVRLDPLYSDHTAREDPKTLVLQPGLKPRSIHDHPPPRDVRARDHRSPYNQAALG
jgi:hypothetical protein